MTTVTIVFNHEDRFPCVSFEELVKEALRGHDGLHKMVDQGLTCEVNKEATFKNPCPECEGTGFESQVACYHYKGTGMADD